MTSKPAPRELAALSCKGLKKVFPKWRIALDYSNPLELLVATILSAQCTDARVNQTTPALFKKYPTARHYAQADPAVFEKEIHATGFFRQKAKSVLGACAAIAERHGGAVPDSMEALCALPGVGRKTANCVLGCAFGKPAIAVDTHVKRVAQRLGLTKQNDPDKIELDVQKLLPESEWTAFANRLILHGRATCTARSPNCPDCFARAFCPSAAKFIAEAEARNV